MREHFGLEELADFPPRYNIAPTQPILIVMEDEHVTGGPRRGRLARWGLIPAWAKDPADIPLLFNARAETAGERNAFRAALRYRRCLVPATGFYEWQKQGGKARSQPHFLRPRDGSLIAFAGLMETFLAPDGSEIDTATILTTQASADLRPIHERMPVVVPQMAFDFWLNCRDNEPADVTRLMGAAPEGLFEAIPVGEAVNSVANMGPTVQDRITPPDDGGSDAPGGQASLPF